MNRDHFTRGDEVLSKSHSFSWNNSLICHRKEGRPVPVVAVTRTAGILTYSRLKAMAENEPTIRPTWDMLA